MIASHQGSGTRTSMNPQKICPRIPWRPICAPIFLPGLRKPGKDQQRQCLVGTPQRTNCSCSHRGPGFSECDVAKLQHMSHNFMELLQQSPAYVNIFVPYCSTLLLYVRSGYLTGNSVSRVSPVAHFTRPGVGVSATRAPFCSRSAPKSGPHVAAAADAAVGPWSCQVGRAWRSKMQLEAARLVVPREKKQSSGSDPTLRRKQMKNKETH